MKINAETLPKFLEPVYFKEHGDQFEQKYGDYTSGNFPNCERFWREFVVPLTRRMDGYPDKVARDINLRQFIDRRLEDIANVHYSLFMNLIFAHLHIEMETLSSLESIYTHLGSVCDLAEMVIEKWYFLLLECQGRETHVLQGLSRDEFIEIALRWYEEKYPEMYQYYLAKGKNPPVELISSDDILEEYYGKKSTSRKIYARQSQAIRQMRNVIVHDVRVARIIERDERALIPKPSVINKYRSWREVAAVIGNEEIIMADFAEQYEQAREDIHGLEHALQGMWEKLIADFKAEFYSEERSILREKFHIAFAGDGPVIANSEDFSAISTAKSVAASGIYNAGTALYPRSSDEKTDQDGNLTTH